MQKDRSTKQRSQQQRRPDGKKADCFIIQVISRNNGKNISVKEL